MRACFCMLHEYMLFAFLHACSMHVFVHTCICTGKVADAGVPGSSFSVFDIMPVCCMWALMALQDEARDILDR